MQFKSLLFTFIFFFVKIATAQIIAIDGVSGYIGSALVKNIAATEIRLGYHKAPLEQAREAGTYIGNIYDPIYMREFLRNVDIYYQNAGITTTIGPKHSLQEYILTNSLGPYLASRVNKNMTMVVLSSVVIYEVDIDETKSIWINKFLTAFARLEAWPDLKELAIKSKLIEFMQQNPIENLPANKYYGFSKILLEKLSRKSAKSRSGAIFILRPSVVIGSDIKTRHGDSLVKNLMQAIAAQKEYQVWNRINCFTPINNLKDMQLYLVANTGEFAKYEIFDVGCVTMNQHEFAKKLINEFNWSGHNLIFVDNKGIDRSPSMLHDDRLEQLYPKLADVDLAIQQMVQHYYE